MKLIKKFFPSQDEAEKYLEKLYDRYCAAWCVCRPLYSESGQYVFKVE